MTLLRTPMPAGSGKALALAPLLLGIILSLVISGEGRKTSADDGGGTAITASIQTIAGTGDAGYNGEGLPLKATQLYWPQDTYVDASGHLWILDWNNHRVVKA